jgi:hypothetical protein
VPGCARTARGHAAAPPNKLMNSRRLMLVPRLRKSIVAAQIGILEGLVDLRFGSLADICAAPKVDIRGYGLNVRFVPKADIRAYSNTSSAVEMRFADTVSPSIFATLRLITNSNLFDSTTGKSAGFSPLRIRPV